MSAAFSVSNTLLHICSNSSSCHNVLILLSLPGMINLCILAGVCAAWLDFSDEVVGSRLSPFHHRKHCWCTHTSLPANFQCTHRVVLVPFCIIYSLHLIAVWFLQATWLPEWSLQLPSFLAVYVSKGRTGRSNTSLRTLCFHFASTWNLLYTCHMQGDWYCLALP